MHSPCGRSRSENRGPSFRIANSSASAEFPITPDSPRMRSAGSCSLLPPARIAFRVSAQSDAASELFLLCFCLRSRSGSFF